MIWSSEDRLGIMEKIYPKKFSFERKTNQIIIKDIEELIDDKNQLKRKNFEGHIPNPHNMIDSIMIQDKSKV